MLGRLWRKPIPSQNDDEKTSLSTEKNNEEIVYGSIQQEEEDKEESQKQLSNNYNLAMDVPLFCWEEPWAISIPVTILCLIPTLFGGSFMAYDLTGRLWPATIFVIYLPFPLLTALLYHIPTNNDNSITSKKRYRHIVTSVVSLLDIYVGNTCWSVANTYLYYFTDVDGTPIIEWSKHRQFLLVFKCLASATVISKLFIGISCLCYRWKNSTSSSPTRLLLIVRPLKVIQEFINVYIMPSPTKRLKVQYRIRILLIVLIFSSFLELFICLGSCISQFGSYNPQYERCDPLDTTECSLPFPSFHHMVQDDTTATGWRVNLRGKTLPIMRGNVATNLDFLNVLDGFSTMAPIMFYINGLREAYEKHGSRIGLQGPSDIQYSITNKSITLLINVDTQQLIPHSAEIDYLDEDHPLVMVIPAQPLFHQTHYAVAVINATDVNGARLPPTEGMQALHLDPNILYKNTDTDTLRRLERYTKIVLPALTKAAPWVSYTDDPVSVQLLFDFVTMSKDSLRPIQAVRDSTLRHIQSSKWGNWMQHVRVVKIYNETCPNDEDEDEDEDDSTNNKNHTFLSSWRSNTGLVARTIHAELDVPWFLSTYGPGQRGAILNDTSSIEKGIPTTFRKAKFVVLVPCSVRSAAFDRPHGKPVRAILEFGHGLFYNRAEAYSHSLKVAANENGYIIMAMDWRGMSSFDIPIVLKALVSTPRLLQAIRDNIIQGYANKLALQHFSQSNEFLTGSWFQFEKDEKGDNYSTKKQQQQQSEIIMTKHDDIITNGPNNNSNNNKESSIIESSSSSITYTVPTFNSKPPISAFYGYSQGGILGAGYTTLLGPTGLIQRVVLGAPGTSLALIQTRSLEFTGYDQLMLNNFHNNRHVRIFLSVIQMAYDSIEASGLLAQQPSSSSSSPLDEETVVDDVEQQQQQKQQQQHRPTYPRILLQAGLGDPAVPTIAAEALARAYNASILPNNPRQNIFGIPVGVAAEASIRYYDDETYYISNSTTITSSYEGPYVTLTELLYVDEYRGLPLDDTLDETINNVHYCLRQDCLLIGQWAEFVNTGRIIDVCENDQCIRRSMPCYLSPFRNNTKLSNWTCAASNDDEVIL